MKIPTIKGVIDRRMLVNYNVDPDVIKNIIPKPFTAKLIDGKAIAGICLIRLKYIRPFGLPSFVGIGSENGAHRIAVEWEEDGKLKEGVYIPRRDSSSIFNTIVGGRIFPGKHHRAKFDVNENEDKYHIAFKSTDGTEISVDAQVTDIFDSRSIFKTISAASNFFKAGALGYSPNGSKLEGLLLNTYKWEVKPLKVSQVRSTFFENESIFPKGSIQFDNALLMTNIEHEWSSVQDINCS